jgi:hypothetical protein
MPQITVRLLAAVGIAVPAPRSPIRSRRCRHKDRGWGCASTWIRERPGSRSGIK